MAGQEVKRDLMLQIGLLEETITVSGNPPPPVEPEKARIAEERRAEFAAKRAEKACSVLSSQSGIPIGGNLRPPAKLKDVRPVYPAHLKQDGIGGLVVLDANIGTDGSVTRVDVVSSPHPDLQLRRGCRPAVVVRFDAAQLRARRRPHESVDHVRASPIADPSQLPTSQSRTVEASGVGSWRLGVDRCFSFIIVARRLHRDVSGGRRDRRTRDTRPRAPVLPAHIRLTASRCRATAPASPRACPTRCPPQLARSPAGRQGAPPPRETDRIRLRVSHLIAGDDRRAFEVDSEPLEHRTGRFHPSAGRDRPWNLGFRQRLQQRSRARQRPYLARNLVVRARVELPQSIERLATEVHPRLSQQHVGEQPTAHADSTMNTPDREVDALRLERLAPGEDVMVDAVDERAIEIEQKSNFSAARARHSWRHCFTPLHTLAMCRLTHCAPTTTSD